MLTALLAAAIVAAASASAAQAVVTVRVSARTTGRAIPPGFVGFSFEFPAVRDYTGSNPSAINPVLVRLIRNLTPGQVPVLRIGGNSTDSSWWPTAAVASTPGITYTLTPSWLATTRALAVRTGAKLILGLNLKLDSATEMSAEAHAFEAGIGRRRIAAFEIGNEPELYANTPWYAGPDGGPVHARPPSWSFSAYLNDVSGLANQLRGNPLAGPATGSTSWVTHAPGLFAAEPGLNVVTYHRYPLIRCFTKPGDPGYPTIPNLLRPRAARDLLGPVDGAIAVAHRHHALFRVDELNSVACSGQPGVSDTFASALWVTDTLFAMAKAGVDGVNIHTLPDAAYEPFAFDQVRGRWLANVRPEYYGLLLFTEAAPPGSRLLATHSSTPAIRASATRTPAGVVHVVLINDSLTATRVARLEVTRRTRSAILERLEAPAAAATQGVRLAGQSFGALTATGKLKGIARSEQLTPTKGHYLIRLPPASAAIVSFAPGAG